MKRRKGREHAFQFLFQFDFTQKLPDQRDFDEFFADKEKDPEILLFSQDIVNGTIRNLAEIELPHSISKRVKEERLKILMEIQKKISLKKYEEMVGQRRIVLVEGPQRERGVLRGRLQTQAPEIDGSVFLNGKARPGDWVEARITQALPYDLLAQIERVLP